MSPTEYREIFSNQNMNRDAQVRGREIAATVSAVTASKMNSLDSSNTATYHVRMTVSRRDGVTVSEPQRRSG